MADHAADTDEPNAMTGRRRGWIVALVGALVLAVGAAVFLTRPSVEPVEVATPPPRAAWQPGEMLKGASVQRAEGQSYADAIDEADRRFGRLDLIRVFYDSAPEPWPGKAPGRDAIVSFKLDPGQVIAGDHDEAMTAWFCAAPREQLTFWTNWHEPERQVDRHTFTAAQYRQAFEHLDTLADTCDNPNLLSTPVLMTWTLRGDHDRDFRDFLPDAEHIDVLSWDVYNDATLTGRYDAPQDLMAQAFDIAAQIDRPIAVAEMGSSLARDDDGTQRAAWLESMLSTLRSNNAVYVAYFDFEWAPQKDYRLADAASLTAWKQG